MDLRALRYFVAVVEQQSFTRAAEHLHVTQPTVSKMVQQLEQELGLALLDRVGKRFTLTDAGDVVLRRARDMLAQHEALQLELADLQRLDRGVLRIGVTLQSHTVLAPLLGDFHRAYPRVELQLFERGAQAIERDLRQGTLELGILLAHAGNLSIWEEFDALPLVQSPICLLAPADAPWQGRSRVALAELASTPFIFYGEAFALNEIVLAACAQAGFTPHITGRSGQWDFMASLVRLGVGVALLPKLFCDTLPVGQFSVIAVDTPAIAWTPMLAWRRDARLSFAARAWLELVRRQMAPALES